MMVDVTVAAAMTMVLSFVQFHFSIPFVLASCVHAFLLIFPVAASFESYVFN